MENGPIPETEYDRVEYPGNAYVGTQIDRLAVLATLQGMRPTDVNNCRVLELGCGDCTNLIPMAVSFPNSHFVGIDLAPSAIGKGKAIAKAAGVANIDLVAMDLLQFDASWGKFDYILAHGFYSWIPDAVRAKFWEVCATQLTPSGVVFTSFNALPGCHLRQISREMMQFHLEQQQTEEAARPAEGLKFLRTIAEATDAKNSWKAISSWEATRLAEREQNVMAHDELGPFFQPYYLHQFLDAAAKAGLQFVAEAKLQELGPERQEKVRAAFGEAAVATPVLTEQYFDFLTGQTFRRVLLCNASITLPPFAPEEHIQELWVSSPLVAQGKDDKGGTIFRHIMNQEEVATNDQRLIQVLQYLAGIFPKAEKVAKLVAQPAGSQMDADAAALAGNLWQMALNDMVDLRSRQNPFGMVEKGRPLASQLARWQASMGHKVTSLDHVEIDNVKGLPGKFFQLLDGSRTMSNLKSELQQLQPGLPSAEATETVQTLLTSFNRIGMLMR